MRLRHCPPSPSSPLLTLSHPRPDHPYARGVPSQHAPNTTDPYACVVPSQHAPDTAYDPYARSSLPKCSRHHLSLRLCSTLLKPLILTLRVPS
ncbi:hypothetical protein O181_125959 [Austropuccinia psidii MF-1]|uniref:Uncharacterized protein n=1 Tax=Austropuccinia psidii MF-1 TaxID=1389203 RepID=A0A9Q3KSG2_9BASI|nr:hypothetical protein [Austropuccinia psidii MF-1]